MSDERDPKVSARYRELAREDPSRELDQIIVSAAHRAADKPHAPLVVPAGRHRWYFALGAAAVLALAVGITVHLQGERPDPEAVSVAQAPFARDETPAPEAKASQTSKSESRELSRSRPAPAVKPLPPEPAGKPASPAPATEDIHRKDDQAKVESQRAPAAAARAERPMTSNRLADAARAEPPERWLERILELRKAGKQEEAEKELAEFRKRHPDYKLPENVVRP